MSDHSEPAKYIVLYYCLGTTRRRLVINRFGQSSSFEYLLETALRVKTWLPCSDVCDQHHKIRLLEIGLLTIFADLPPFKLMLYPNGVQRVEDRIEVELGILEE